MAIVAIVLPGPVPPSADAELAFAWVMPSKRLERLPTDWKTLRGDAETLTAPKAHGLPRP